MTTAGNTDHSAFGDSDDGARSGPLSGLKVIDAATIFAGPMAGTMLADFGADVLKVEHPTKADPVRWHGASKDGVGLWWKMIGRNKRAITLYLGSPEGQEILKELIADADVLIENFRPGTLERWGLSPETLHEINPGLVIARVTGFGQFGPYSSRAGFGTLAEAMSGFAAVTGEPDGPPTLPPFGLADGIAALATALVTCLVLYPWLIRQLQLKQIGQVIRNDGPESHFAKRGTPTMGGTLLVISVVGACLLWCNLNNPFVWLTLVITVIYAVVGFLDDFLKLHHRNTGGLSERWKILTQVGSVALVMWYLEVT